MNQLLKIVPVCLLLSSFTTFADVKPGYLADYQYQVSDIADYGLNSTKLFSEVRNDWMELEHSVCANRALVWGYDLYRKYKLNVGRIFVFFVSDIWKNDKKGWKYHAGTYVIENGKEVILERSYPKEIFGPVDIVKWIDNEMEGREDPKKCIEITSADRDLTEYFYGRGNLPRKREKGLPSAPCYYRKVPGYVAYPATVAELELGKDEEGKPTDYKLTGYDKEELYTACVDAASGGKWIRRKDARSFCSSYIN